ncbi:MAG TPA: type II secretion system major pseudopilin GspG [Candidatus Omnitrophota bacterium]|nr:type II secretion system major pseudopilin GspG [Candidatus Omnitrophota bacterium]
MRRSGFTFVEILLVVVIIGILASMVLPRFVGRSEQARQQVALSDINSSIATALDMYELDNGVYPDKIGDLMEKPGELKSWSGPYLKKKPVDPWGREYIYKPSSDKKDYELITYGRDGVSGGGDDVTSKQSSEERQD